jgi:hypothetical protein
MLLSQHGLKGQQLSLGGGKHQILQCTRSTVCNALISARLQCTLRCKSQLRPSNRTVLADASTCYSNERAASSLLPL